MACAVRVHPEVTGTRLTAVDEPINAYRRRRGGAQTSLLAAAQHRARECRPVQGQGEVAGIWRTTSLEPPKGYTVQVGEYSPLRDPAADRRASSST
jgi:phage protein U